ncbi:zinc-binding alcohol dehydrogenase family protein [Kribbella sp. NPDC051620]|uniref:zinc-binding alcohol dehydrogenase family protein n=1 Tax=Kribbella sp. NPDC051620 TaxID=3364120 RepID=UPI003797CA06
MRAIRYYEHGGPDVLQVADVAIPEPADGQVLIEVEAVGANAIDTTFRSGNTPWPRSLPGALTGDVVGRITRLGPGSPSGVQASLPPGIQVGQRVAALSEDAFAEQVVVDAEWLVPIPEDTDAGAATTLSMPAPLALRLLKAGRLQPGETVLIQSAAGGIGHLAVQLARALGAGTVIGTASSAAKLDFILEQGADLAIDLSDGDWAARLPPIDVVLDSVGGKTFDQGLKQLAPLGRMVTYGAISGELPTVHASSLFSLISVTGVSMLGWRSARPAEARADITEVTRLLQSGDLRPVTSTPYPLAEISRLHQTLDARTNLGRLIATI